MDSYMFGYAVGHEDRPEGAVMRWFSVGSRVVRSTAELEAFAEWLAASHRRSESWYTGGLEVAVWRHPLGLPLPRLTFADEALPKDAQTFRYAARSPRAAESNAVPDWVIR
ncbi:hypothetical protein ACGF12_35770 [Kitasatospora sp. NPDC048296]|uniref:hypothetical protein n=1 Tax=Kitasatospora sp. NPDC048296 TaxID=3364048 RepID=UPI00371A30FC